MIARGCAQLLEAFALTPTFLPLDSELLTVADYLLPHGDRPEPSPALLVAEEVRRAQTEAKARAAAAVPENVIIYDEDEKAVEEEAVAAEYNEAPASPVVAAASSDAVQAAMQEAKHSGYERAMRLLEEKGEVYQTLQNEAKTIWRLMSEFLIAMRYEHEQAILLLFLSLSHELSSSRKKDTGYRSEFYISFEMKEDPLKNITYYREMAQVASLLRSKLRK